MIINCIFSSISHAESVLGDIQSALTGIDRLNTEELSHPGLNGVVQLSGEAISQKATSGGAAVSFYCPDESVQQVIGQLKSAGARKINLCG